MNLTSRERSHGFLTVTEKLKSALHFYNFSGVFCNMFRPLPFHIKSQLNKFAKIIRNLFNKLICMCSDPPSAIRFLTSFYSKILRDLLLLHLSISKTTSCAAIYKFFHVWYLSSSESF